MLPLSLLKITYNGHLVNCDTWMKTFISGKLFDGDWFWRMPKCYICGNTIKYLRVLDEVIDKVQEETKSRLDHKPTRVGRGRGRGREDGPGASGGCGKGGPDGKASGNRVKKCS
ncbi:hypothetical protein UlMin_012706 [Ulmus minor]